MSLATAIFIDDGIEEKERRRISEALAKILADTYTLYLKAQNYHWNVTGPMFHSLHQEFEKNYEDLAAAVDLIAERIRALGFPAPATFRDFLRLSTIHEDETKLEAEEMIRSLVEGHETVTKECRALAPIAEQVNDQVTVDMLGDRMQAHEKAAWMLRSLLA